MLLRTIRLSTGCVGLRKLTGEAKRRLVPFTCTAALFGFAGVAKGAAHPRPLPLRRPDAVN
ncbi:hypothetical protein SCLCIDRAFT_1219030 [Scleroderma citrinum Foug A]|uniref:Uncharacterized protein n=1 Tax=Scleroderma citrinum Foug A TaxID=1036808 RepID=A0A0C3DB64_9AGAM|nr:hypothetical protein SCLCIDRAFT_1219030 [Scleroderma citrinum Foug A]